MTICISLGQCSLVLVVELPERLIDLGRSIGLKSFKPIDICSISINCILFL